MAEVIGPATIVRRAIPTGVDGARVAEWRMRDGLTFREFVDRIALAIGEFNTRMANKWSWLYSLTEEDMMEYPDGGSITPLQAITDLDRVDMVHGETIGHMVDLKPYGGAVGGSWRYYRDSREAQILSDIRTIIRRAEWRFELALHTRLFVNTENAIGSAGYDVPFVRGTGGNIDFTPPAMDGVAFASSHDHFIGLDSGSKTGANQLNEMAATLEEHGHQAPFTALVSRADVATFAALPDFVQLVMPRITMVDRAAVTSGNEFFASGTPQVTGGAFGYYQSNYGEVELRSTNRVPTGHAAMVKSYGNNDPRNSLAVRVHPDQGFGLFIVPSMSDEDAYPVKRLNIEFEFGVGVGEDRTNGTSSKLVSGGTYGNPTIS